MNADFRPSLNGDIRSLNSTVFYFLSHVLGFPTRRLKIDSKKEGRGSLVGSGREEEERKEE